MFCFVFLKDVICAGEVDLRSDHGRKKKNMGALLDIISHPQSQLVQSQLWVTVLDSRLGENPGPTGSRGNVGLLWIIWTDNR